MPRSLSKNLRRRGALPALVTALAVGVWLLLQRLLEFGIWKLSVLATPPADAFFDNFHVSGAAGVHGEILPIVVGVFLSLWMIAPVAGELRLRHVIARAVLAAAIAAVLFAAVQGVVNGVALVQSWSANVPGQSLGETLRDIVVEAIVGGALSFVSLLPLVILAAVFEWLWLRDREPKHPVAGMLDEV